MQYWIIVVIDLSKHTEPAMLYTGSSIGGEVTLGRSGSTLVAERDLATVVKAIKRAYPELLVIPEPL